MEVDPYELVVRWYLRFNRYLAVENFVVHEAIEGGNAQIGECDILAVRFPYSSEAPGLEIRLDPKMADDCATDVIDFVIAEVKGGERNKLNKVWKPPSNDEKTARVS